MKKFIKTDCKVAIGSSGIIGDRILNITQGSSTAHMINEGQSLASAEPVETDAILASIKVTAVNAEIISLQLVNMLLKINSGNGTLSRLIQDSTIAENLNQTMMNLKKSSKGLDENMQAAKHNFLFKGYFNKKAKDAEKKKKDAEEQILEQKKKK